MTKKPSRKEAFEMIASGMSVNEMVDKGLSKNAIYQLRYEYNKKHKKKEAEPVKKDNKEIAKLKDEIKVLKDQVKTLKAEKHTADRWAKYYEGENVELRKRLTETRKEAAMENERLQRRLTGLLQYVAVDVS